MLHADVSAEAEMDAVVEDRLSLSAAGLGRSVRRSHALAVTGTIRRDSDVQSSPVESSSFPLLLPLRRLYTVGRKSKLTTASNCQ